MRILLTNSSNKDQSAVSVNAMWFVGQMRISTENCWVPWKQLHIKTQPSNRVPHLSQSASTLALLHTIMKFSAFALFLWLAVVGAVKLPPPLPHNFGFVTPRKYTTTLGSPAARMHEAKLVKRMVKEKEAKLEQSDEESYTRHREMKVQRSELAEKKRRIDASEDI